MQRTDLPGPTIRTDRRHDPSGEPASSPTRAPATANAPPTAAARDAGRPRSRPAPTCPHVSRHLPADQPHQQIHTGVHRPVRQRLVVRHRRRVRQPAALADEPGEQISSRIRPFLTATGHTAATSRRPISAHLRRETGQQHRHQPRRRHPGRQTHRPKPTPHAPTSSAAPKAANTCVLTARPPSPPYHTTDVA